MPGGNYLNGTVFAMTSDRIYFGDNLPILRSLEDSSIDLIYIDPPFNTGRTQARTRISTVRTEEGDRKGFMGQKYQTVKLGTSAYVDIFDDFLEFITPRLSEAHRLLKPNGSLFFHIDYREVHYCKVTLDAIFGRASFVNEIIWAYDYGARTRKRWPPKHDTILWYAKDPANYIFNYEDIERIPYMAPGLVSPEKVARGKTPTDTWWHSIVGTNSRERTGYPTQKPEGVIRRIIQASSHKGDIVLDFFAGSGTTGAVCLELGRNFILVDNNLAAMKIMAERFKDNPSIEWIGYDPKS